MGAGVASEGPPGFYGWLCNAQSIADETWWAIDAANHFLADNQLPGRWLGHHQTVLGIFDLEPKARSAEATGRFQETYRALTRKLFAFKVSQASENASSGVEKKRHAESSGGRPLFSVLHPFYERMIVGLHPSHLVDSKLKAA